MNWKKIPEEIDNHHEEADNAFLQKAEDNRLAKKGQSLNVTPFYFQQCLPTPFLFTNVSF